MFPVRLSEIPAVQAAADIVGARHGRRGRNRLGEIVQVRHLDRGDVEVMARLFDGLSAQGRYLRFLSAVPRFSARTLELLADTDGINHVALVAFRAEQPIGEARFVRSATEPDAAELALAVVDDEQRRGVGRMLVVALAEEAERLGVRRFTFDVSPENRRVLSLLDRSGARRRLADQVVSGEVLVRTLLTADSAAATPASDTSSRAAA